MDKLVEATGILDQSTGTSSEETSGGLNNYYLVRVENPQRENQPPYQAECEDIIEALGLTFDEGNIFKEIWRSANARKGNGKPGNTAKRGAEKILHYATRIHRRALRPVITVIKTY